MPSPFGREWRSRPQAGHHPDYRPARRSALVAGKPRPDRRAPLREAKNVGSPWRRAGEARDLVPCLRGRGPPGLGGGELERRLVRLPIGGSDDMNKIPIGSLALV